MPDQPRIAHVGVAVPDIEAALAFYRDVLGLAPLPAESVDGANIVCLPVGESKIELLSPRDPDSPIARFLTRRGPGIHHICYRVADLDATLEACRQAGYTLIDHAPRIGVGGRRIAFVHPRSTSGILLELSD